MATKKVRSLFSRIFMKSRRIGYRQKNDDIPKKDAVTFFSLLRLAAIPHMLLFRQIHLHGIEHFAEPLEMNDFTLPQETQRIFYTGVISAHNQVFIGRPGFWSAAIFSVRSVMGSPRQAMYFADQGMPLASVQNKP